MADVLEGYKQISEEDQRKAKAFFDRAKTVADTGNYDYAIEMFLQGLNLDPDAVEAHQALRDVSLRRKASGGKDLGFMEKMKFKRPSKDDKTNMLAAEKLLAYDPGNCDNMVGVLQNAFRAGLYDTVMWIGPILQKANADSIKPAPDFNKFITLKDIYKELRQWKLATDACQYAAMLRPDDMELQGELKNLGAQHTMDQGNYTTGKSFRDSIKDMDSQQKLLDLDKDIRTVDAMTRVVAAAEEEYRSDTNDPSKLTKLVDALVKTEQTEHENRALELLEEWYKKSQQFRYRMRIGDIQMRQMSRMERSKREAVSKDPQNAELVAEYKEFHADRIKFELEEFTLWAENYPTESRWKYEMGLRLFTLGRYDDAIPVLQTARQDPKYRGPAAIYLGRAFFEAGFFDEADDTLGTAIADYPAKGDERSKEMYYWRARTLQQKGLGDEAIKLYSQLAQWDFRYRDVQTRIKELRAAKGAQ